jgi:hypothetical protein
VVRAGAAALVGVAALVFAAPPALADLGQGSGLQSGTVNCSPLGTVVVTSPPGHAITPVAYIDGNVFLTQSETISGPRGTITQTYPVPTDDRLTISCTVTFGLVTISWTAVQIV